MAELFTVTKARLVDRRDTEKAGLSVEPGIPPGLFDPRVVTTSDVWVMAKYGAWRAAYRIAIHNGHAVVGELRVYPLDQETAEGEWSGGLRGLRAEVPIGGLTATLVHQIKLGADVGEGRLVVGSMEHGARRKRRHSSIRKELRASGLISLLPPPTSTRSGAGGPRGKGIGFYRKVAALYKTARARGSRRPNHEIADALGLTPEQARDAVYRARRLGLLERAPRKGVMPIL